jgi:hypothetical protein
MQELMQTLENEKKANEHLETKLHEADSGLADDIKKKEEAEQELKIAKVLADIANARHEREQKEILLKQINTQREECQYETEELNVSRSQVFIIKNIWFFLLCICIYPIKYMF